MIKDPELYERLVRNCTIDTISGCWNWTAYQDYKGYGRVTFNNRNYPAHRLMAYVTLGFDLNSKLVVMHKCDNKKCINPEHLEIGTVAQNNYDFQKRLLHPGFCANGHPREGNLFINSEGTKRCKICQKEKVSRYLSKKRSLKQKETESNTANINNSTDKKE